jgi:hypothetical protein
LGFYTLIHKEAAMRSAFFLSVCSLVFALLACGTSETATVEPAETDTLVANRPEQQEIKAGGAENPTATHVDHQDPYAGLFSANSDAIVGVADAADAETRGWTDVVQKLAPPLLSYLFSDTYRWGPMMCAAPRYDDPAPSKAEAGAHSRKLYLLWVREYEPYLELTEQPVGQTIWKLTWYPAADAKPGERKPGARGPTFIMHKLDPATEGTDEGWIYAAIDYESGKVTAAGKLANCMGCHKDARKDRMFGLPPKEE